MPAAGGVELEAELVEHAAHLAGLAFVARLPSGPSAAVCAPLDAIERGFDAAEFCADVGFLAGLSLSARDQAQRGAAIERVRRQQRIADRFWLVAPVDGAIEPVVAGSAMPLSAVARDSSVACRRIRSSSFCSNCS